MQSHVARYEEACATFSWTTIRRDLGVARGEGLNIGTVAVDRHARGSAGSRVALRFVWDRVGRRETTYGELARDSNRFVGRRDDVIKLAGHLVGPVEVEHVLLDHEAVAEVGVVGRPHAVAGEVVKAFVTLAPNYEPTPETAEAILAFGRSRLGAGLAPKEVAFMKLRERASMAGGGA